MWGHGKDMIMQVGDVSLVCLTQYDYDMLISQMKVATKGNSHPKPKELMIMFMRGVNILWPRISFMINDDFKVIPKETLA